MSRAMLTTVRTVYSVTGRFMGEEGELLCRARNNSVVAILSPDVSHEEGKRSKNFNHSLHPGKYHIYLKHVSF